MKIDKEPRPQSNQIDFYIKEQPMMVGLVSPENLRTALQLLEAGSASEWFDVMMNMISSDASITAYHSKRMIGVNSLNWRIDPWSTAATSDEKRQAAELQDVLENIMDIPELLMNLAYGILPGFSMIEIIDIENPVKSGWTKIMSGGRSIWYPKMAFRPLSWFQTNPKHRDILYLRDQVNGIPLARGLWVQHKHPLMPGNIGNTGCMRSLAYAYLIKNHGIQDWTELLSILGVPPRIGFYDINTSQPDKAALRLAVQTLGKNASAIMPKGMDIEYQSAAQITSNPFIEIVTYAEKVYQELILGVSMSDIAKKTSVEGSKFLSNATYQRNKWDAHYLEQTIRRDILYYMNGYNNDVWDLLKCPKFKFDIRITGEFGSQADGLLKIAQTGLKIGKAWAHDHLNIPIPKDGEEVLNPDDFKSDDNQAELKKKVVALKKEDDVDIIEDAATAASMESDKILGDLMKTIETAKDYDELQDVLTAYFETVDVVMVEDLAVKSTFMHMQGILDPL